MGSVMTEVVHETSHPWTSAMKDAPSHQQQPDTQSPTNKASSQHSRSNSSHTRQSRHATASSRSSHSTSQSRSASRASSGHAPSHSSTPLSTKTPSQPREQPPSPRLPPAESSETIRPPAPQNLTSSLNTLDDLASSTAGREDSRLVGTPSPSTVPKISVKNLQHIQNFAGTDMSSKDGSDEAASPQYIINEMPIDQVIEMVAGLLTKITTTNDQHYEHLHRSIPHPDAAAGLSHQTTSVLAFHGKNVPSITIMQYLGRIQKYCPATYEVFLSLLVYFDRMTERVNSGQLHHLRQAADQESQDRVRSQSTRQKTSDRASPQVTPPSSETMSPRVRRADQAPAQSHPQEPPSPPLSDSDPMDLSSFFVVDSFNIHRLIIAGMTCAAKFFSDVFFTNARYAKVGGLPGVELNHLELQFLMLNDFRLAIPVEELEQYATMLVEFYAREVVAQRQAEGMEGIRMPSR